MVLDLSAFKKALSSLKKVWDIYTNETNDDITRDSVIQRFEYTYSMSLKIMNRYISLNPTEETETIYTFNELIRKANKNDLLLNNLEQWTLYREKRNMTSHTYDEAKALEVISIMGDFIKDAEFLLNRLEERNAS